MDKRLIDKLIKRKEEGTFRSLSVFNNYIDFFSNDYLGFARLIESRTDVPTGGTGSRLISGNSNLIVDAELQMARHFESDASLMFNSGYDANIGFFSSVPQRGDTILYDELIHASIRDGVRLSLANAFSFKHNDLTDLKNRLEATKGSVYVAIESLYSMDGDIASLNEIATLCEDHRAFLIVDEAHAAGVFGDKGRGIVYDQNLQEKVFARIITFGKAYGSHGACVLGDKELIDYLINFARSFIYTTALPEYVYERNLARVMLDNIDQVRLRLHDNIAYFRRQFTDPRLISHDQSPVQVLLVGNIPETRALAKQIEEQKIAVKPIYSPTVKAGSERIRLCIHAFNTHEQIDQLVDALNKELNH